MQRLNVLAFSLATTILSGIVIFGLSIWNAATGFAASFVDMFVKLHPHGIEKVAGGSFWDNAGFILINTGFALVDGFILAYLLAVIYNWLCGRLGGDSASPAGKPSTVADDEAPTVHQG